jgi:hypothetical protein
MQDNRLALKCGGIEPKRRAGELVAKRQPFSNAGGTFRGIVGNPDTLGELPPEWRHAFPRTHVDYTILSYSTPIAWLTEGRWIMPPVTYSPTTTQHQGVLRAWLLVGEEVAA